MSIPCEAMVQLRAYPSTRTLSLALPPCALSTLIALIGYLASPLFPARLTAMTALTIISLKKSDAWLISFDDRDVFATFTTLSLPSSSTLIVKCSWIYLHASLKNKKDQIKTLHLCLSWVRILSFIDLLSKIRNNLIDLMPLVLATLVIIQMFSLTRPASMQIYWNKRKHLHKKRVQLPQELELIHQHRRRFIFWNTRMATMTSCRPPNNNSLSLDNIPLMFVYIWQNPSRVETWWLNRPDI